jgi:hypothetical protein
MRSLLLAFALLSACSPAPAPRAEPEAPLPPPAAEPWFICDGLDQPIVLVFERMGRAARATEYSKNGAQTQTYTFSLGQAEGAAGSIYTPLQRDGAEAGHVRQFNAGVLETPGAAYTTPISSVRIGERDISCRWLPRTRLTGFTEARSFVVHEDADGDLIYSSFNFADASSARLIELTENGRTTTFSAEARDGQEHVRPESTEFRFAAPPNFTYVITRTRDGAATLVVLRDGAEVQRESVIAAQQGAANLE